MDKPETLTDAFEIFCHAVEGDDIMTTPEQKRRACMSFWGGVMSARTVFKEVTEGAELTADGKAALDMMDAEILTAGFGFKLQRKP